MLSGIAKLGSASFLLIIINIFSYPLLTTFYSPEEYGKYSLFLYLSSLFTVVILLKIDLIIPTLKGDENLTKGVNCGLISILLISIVVFFTTSILAGYYNYDFYLVVALLLSNVFFGLYTLLNSVYIQRGMYKFSGIMTLVQGGVLVLLQLMLSFSQLGWHGLLLGYILSFFLTFVFFAIYSFKLSSLIDVLKSFNSISWIEYKKFLICHKGQWAGNVTQSFLNVLSLNVLAYGVQTIGGISAVGAFSLCQKILVIPVRLIGNSTKQVMLKELAVVDHDTQISVVKNVTKILIILALSIFASIYFILPIVITYLFPISWHGVIPYVLPLSIWLGFTIVYTPTISYLNVIKRVSYHTLYEAVNLFLRIVVFIVLTNSLFSVTAVEFVTITSIASSLAIVSFLVYSLRKYKGYS
ncbi:TPA: hypothetical protein RQK07_001437 [Vibrio vulnificus]|nr:hypothetical protein [Vibrio vulnificus]HDY7687588.1 hypothetical protein [Vibrio vulnificus]